MSECHRSYQFRHKRGGSMPYQTLGAVDDADFYKKLKKFLDGAGTTLVSGSIQCTIMERYEVPDPPVLSAMAPLEA